MKIGLISDTHFTNSANLQVEDWIKKAFAGVEMIVHAGDVEINEYLNLLSEIAPVYPVRGNCDHRLHFETPICRSIKVGNGLLTVAHRPEQAREGLLPESIVMVYGHTHLATIAHESNGLLVINPGSPTMPRGGLPPSVAVLTVDGSSLSAKIVVR